MSDSVKLHELLPNHIVSTPAWKTFADKVEELISENVWDYVEALQKLKKPLEVETEFLNLLARHLGLDVRSDIFTESQYRKIVEAIYEYYRECGNLKRLEQILSYAHDIEVIRISPLWSQDYNTFLVNVPSGAGTIYKGDGNWFFTPHVEISLSSEYGYKASKILPMTGSLGTPISALGAMYLGNIQYTFADFDKIFDESKLIELFNNLAPIHLVMERLVNLVTAVSTIYVTCALRMTIIEDSAEIDPVLSVISYTTNKIIM